MRYIGIDPGVSGGVAVLDHKGKFLDAWKMPTTGRDLIDSLDAVSGLGNGMDARAMVERVGHGIFGGTGRRMGSKSAFTFGRNVERIHMALLASCIPFDEVAPAVWQGALGCRTGGDKNVSKARAQQLFPKVKVTHAIADALLIAEYLRRQNLSRRTAPELTQEQPR